MITKEELESYLEDNKTLTDIAEICKVSITTIRRWIEKLGIKREQRKSPSITKPKKDKTLICPNCGISFTYEKYIPECCSTKCAHELMSKRTYEKYKLDNSICYGVQNMQNYKKHFLEEQNHKCDICGIIDTWNDQELVFVLDHIDGNADNNERNNLRLVCPNCDSQLDTFKSKNKNSARAKYRK